MSLDVIKALVEKEEKVLGLSDGSTKVIAVSKLQPNDRVRHVLDSGHRVFGENRVQEALRKWPEFKNKYDGIELHLLGPLQRNKVRQAMSLFDYIHTVDSLKLVKKIAEIRDEISFCPKLFIQVNIGNEEQKAGVDVSNLGELLLACKHFNLLVCGLMCIPPSHEDPLKHFLALKNLAKKENLKELSMGMSNDFEVAIRSGATFIRVGSAIFGQRP
ncbi:MAG: YggS family pyridoxal phosphate-dependent enzyme [Paracoccaceae bacterium]